MIEDDTIERPAGLVEVPDRFLAYFEFLLGMYSNPSRGNSGTATQVLARRLWRQRPRALAIGDTVLWLERRTPRGRYTVHEMTRSQLEELYILINIIYLSHLFHSSRR